MQLCTWRPIPTRRSLILMNAICAYVEAPSSEGAGGVRPAPGPLAHARVLVCDDDPLVRAAITEMVEERAGSVIAETDRSRDAIDLIERFEPDVVVVDLGLAQGSGKEIIDFVAALEHSPRVIVFTSFDGVGISAPPGLVQIVLKPDFELLGRCLDSPPPEAPRGERRRPARTVSAPGPREPSGADRADDFYQTLADAQPDDTLVAVSLRGLDAATVVEQVRRTIRVQDRLVARGHAVVVLLISGTAAAPDALCRRLAQAIPDIDDRATSRSCGDDPVDAFIAIDHAARGEAC